MKLQDAAREYKTEQMSLRKETIASVVSRKRRGEESQHELIWRVQMTWQQGFGLAREGPAQDISDCISAQDRNDTRNFTNCLQYFCTILVQRAGPDSRGRLEATPGRMDGKTEAGLREEGRKQR